LTFSLGQRLLNVLNADISVTEILHRVFLRNSLQAWLVAILTAAILFVVLVIARKLLVSHLGKLAARTINQVDDMVVAMLGQTRTWVLLTLAVLTGVHALDLARLSEYQGPLARLVLLWRRRYELQRDTFWVSHHLMHPQSSARRDRDDQRDGSGRIGAWCACCSTLKSVFDVGDHRADHRQE
jgi:hypothetical protein